MRIVYLLTSLGIGGAERQVIALASRMKQRGHTVALMVLRPPIAEQWSTDLDGFHLDMQRTTLSVIAGLTRGRAFLRDFMPDLVHSHSFHANFAARLLKIFLRKPIVISTIHNVYEGGWRRMLAYRLSDFLCSRTTAVSTAAAERFVRLKAVPQHKCIVITNGIDIEEFCSNAERRAQMRSTMQAKEDFIWLAAGRIVPAKDIPNLLRAFAALRVRIPDTQLWIAGQGDPAEAMRETGIEADLFNWVRWLGVRRDLPALMDAADGFVLSSAWEGMPLVVAEAMAMQKLVVATDVGGVRELVGDCGLAVAAKAPAPLADAMLEGMQKSASERLGLGLKSRERICRHFNMDTKADEWEALYRTVWG